MNERPDGADGLGRSSSGTPDFAAPTPPAPPAAPAPPFPPPLPAPATRPSRRPALFTAAAVLVVAAVTLLATLAAWRSDTQVPPPPPSPTRTVPSTADPDRDAILFTGAHGTGRLAVREHTWETGPDRLRLSVELSCTTGTVDHGPDSFQLFDADGTLVEASPAGGGGGSLDYGTLGPGELVRGEVLFDVSRQVVTLVLSDDAGSVTALRITD
jgi:hypothetical protein